MHEQAALGDLQVLFRAAINGDSDVVVFGGEIPEGTGGIGPASRRSGLSHWRGPERSRRYRQSWRPVTTPEFRSCLKAGLPASSAAPNRWQMASFFRSTA